MAELKDTDAGQVHEGVQIEGSIEQHGEVPIEDSSTLTKEVQIEGAGEHHGEVQLKGSIKQDEEVQIEGSIEQHEEEPIEGSKQEQSHVCGPCKFVNTIHVAVGWCETCDEMLCNDCYTTHCGLKMMRHHQLYPITEIDIPKQRKRIENKCTEHDGKLLKYFCDDHSELGCSQCFVTKHRLCSKVVCIAEVKTSECEEFKALLKLLSDLDTRLKSNEERLKRNKTFTAGQHDTAIADIGEAERKLKTLIDTLVKKQIAEAEQYNDVNSQNLSDIERLTKDIASKLDCSSELLSEADGDNYQLFILMKHLQNETVCIETNLDESDRKNKVNEYEFVLNQELVSVLKKVTELGKMTSKTILDMEKATDEVRDEFEVRRFRSTYGEWEYEGDVDAIRVSTNQNIRLLDVLLFPCLEGDTEVELTVSEGGHRLINCNITHENTDEDVVAVKVENVGGGHGVFLQADHQYDVAVMIKGDSSRCGINGQSNVTVEGVSFSFSDTVSPNMTDINGGQIAGFRFTPL